MKNGLLQQATRFYQNWRRKQLWYRMVSGMACVVVFCTVYALILPAITMEKEPACGLEEHTHTEACYTVETVWPSTEYLCGEDPAGHVHDDEACYDEDGNLICGYADFVVHTHDESCYDRNGDLACPLEEIEEHRHDADCYSSTEVLTCGEEETGHVHDKSCYTRVRGDMTCGLEKEEGHTHGSGCYETERDLVCTLEEGEDHTHDESCYETRQVLTCELEENEGHTHGDSCYDWTEELTCGREEAEGHIHDGSCYTTVRELVCDEEEVTLHTHDEDCFDEDGNLICGKVQVLAHQHDETCAVEPEGEPEEVQVLTCGLKEHTHTDACYEPQIQQPAEEEPDYLCGLEEHTHGEDCYDEAGELTCGLEEHTHSEACTPAEAEDVAFCGKEPHAHDTECWDAAGNLICTLEEHAHSLACYADPNADTETAADWEQTFAAVTPTGKWREDLIAIAETQLGYAESTKNYLVEDDGVSLKGYTRYGDWYGQTIDDPNAMYDDWDAMFVSFCMHYAGVVDVPLSGECGSWVAALADKFVPAASHIPAPGELVFFDRDGNGTADHVGILVGITDSPEAAARTFTTIEGDVADAVQTVTYSADEASVLGYGILPEQAGEFTLTAQTETGIIVTITGESASLPYPVGKITATVVEVEDKESQAIRDQLLEEETVEAEQRFLLDITLWHDGEEIEPTGPVTVTFSGFDTEGFYPKVYHIDTEANEATDMDAVKGEAGDITVSTDHFSLYDVQLMSAPEGTGISGENITQIADGGKYYLTGTANTSNTITITKDTVLDLNGYGVYYQGTDNFLVVNGGTLTIKDSRPASVSESNGSGNLYGNAASLSFESNGNKPVKLTYYVTESSANGTGTSETLKKYEVTPTGCIVGEAGGGAASIVKVSSGATCNLEGGLLTIKNSSSYNGDARIIFNSGTLNLRGGYVAGGKDSCWGGGIFSENGTVNMSGGVIADNYGTNGGGLCVKGGSFTMTGGVISGNGTHSNNVSTGSWDKGLGGGIFAENATVRIEGGYITNNSEYGKCGQDGFGCHGGGGIATTGGSLTMTGGFVTGNYSQEAGGGIYVGHYNLGGTEFSMSGGIVAGNVAEKSEGGGIRISGWTTGVINASGGKVYITNNRTNSTYDWGGGGIFVQEKGTLNIYNSLITSNSAGGFGGGVGACPTGETLIVHKDGAAIYSNTASGANMSSGGNGKNYDDTVAKASTVFMSNGYQDYFCVRGKGSNSDISLVTGEMVGGGAANWSGSCDEKAITISKTGHAAAKYLFGLTAHPDSSAISSAQSVAGVVITGNSAHTHGGGIMTNGGLILGNTEGNIVTATPSLDISGTKTLLKDGVAQNGGLNFQFQLKNSEGEVVGTATADSSTGRFTISPNTKYEKAGTYTYYLTEVNDGRTGVTYDASQYRIDVTIAEKSVTLLGVTFKSYYVDSVNVSKTGGADTTEPTQPDTQPDTHPNTFRVHFKKPNDWGTVNMYIWEGNDLPNSATWPGDPVDPDPAHPDWYTKEFTVSRSNNFKYIFSYYNNNQTVNQTNDLSGNYSPGGDLWVYADGNSTTTAPSDWNGGSSGSTGSNVSFTGTKNSDESYSLTINGSAFTNTIPNGKLELTKTVRNTAGGDTSGEFEFELKYPVREGWAGASCPVTYTSSGSGQTHTGGTLSFTPQDGYAVATVKLYHDETVTVSELPTGAQVTATELNADGYSVGWKADGSETYAKAVTVTIPDGSVAASVTCTNTTGMEFPETGGAGTGLYTMGGLLLIAGAGILLLRERAKRRREDGITA